MTSTGNEVEPDVASNDLTPSGLSEDQDDIEKRFREWKMERDVSRQARVVDEKITDKVFCNELQTLLNRLGQNYKRINVRAFVRLNRNTVGWFSGTENRQAILREISELSDWGERFGLAVFDYLESSEEVKNQTKAALSESLYSLGIAAKNTDTPLFDESFEVFQSVKEYAIRLLSMSTSVTP